MKTVGVGTLVLALMLAVSACGEVGTPNPGTPNPGAPDPDTYTDPGTEAPEPVVEPSVMTSAALRVENADEALLGITLAGFGVERAGETVPVDALPATAFTVVENGIVQGIKVERVTPASPVASDIVFVLDTTLSMGVGLSSAQSSLDGFVRLLEAAGLDVRLGALTFGDAFDTKAPGSARGGVSFQNRPPPEFDSDERPSFPLSDNLAAFRTFIAEDSPRGGGLSPENVAGALEYAYTTFAWRDGAQRILVVITDTCAHTQTSSGYLDFITAPWLPRPLDALMSDLRGRASVHVIGAEGPCSKLEDTFDPSLLTGARGTGGVFHAWFDGGPYARFDLAELTLGKVLAGGYKLSYKGELNAQPKALRVVIDDGADIRGELTLQTTY